MRITKRHMRLRRNQQRTTTNQSPFRNKKIRKSSNHNRRNKRQRPRHGQTSPKNENRLRLRRNRQKRPNPTPRRPQRQNNRIPPKPNGLPKRKHRSHINQAQQEHNKTMDILKNLRDTVKNLKHSPSTPKLCPKCGNHKIRLSTGFDGWIFPTQYLCPACGYKGPIILELEKTQENTATDENQLT